MVATVAILKIFKPHLLPKDKSDWAETWLEALGRHGDLDLLKAFCYRIQNGHHGNHLKDLQLLAHLELCSGTAYAVACCLLSVHPSLTFSHFGHLLQNRKLNWAGMVGGIGATWRVRMAKVFAFHYPKLQPLQPSWKPSNHMCSWMVSWNEPKLVGRHWGNIEIQNC